MSSIVAPAGRTRAQLRMAAQNAASAAAAAASQQPAAPAALDTTALLVQLLQQQHLQAVLTNANAELAAAEALAQRGSIQSVNILLTNLVRVIASVLCFF